MSFVVHEGTKLHSGLTLVGIALSPAARASGCDQPDSVASLTMRRGCQKAFKFSGYTRDNRGQGHRYDTIDSHYSSSLKVMLIIIVLLQRNI